MSTAPTEFVKRRPEVDGEVLEREAEVLRALAAQPVVDLVDCTTAHGQVELRTRLAGSATLADADRLPLRAVLRAAAGVCRDVVAVHRAGWGHGALHPGHVVVGGRGRTTLCSLGRAQPLVAAPELVAVDTAAVTTALLETADVLEASDDRSRRRAAVAVRKALGDGGTDLLDVAAAIESTQVGDAAPRPGWRTPLAAALLLVLTVTVAGAWTTGADEHAAPGASALRPTTTTSLPRSPAGALRAGDAEDQSVVVDLDCDGDDELLLLRPSTGELFVAPRLPSGARHVRTVPVGHARGAVSLTTSTSPGGCATALAAMPDGSTVPVDLGVDGAAPPPSTVVPAPPTSSTPATPGRSPTTVPARTAPEGGTRARPSAGPPRPTVRPPAAAPPTSPVPPSSPRTTEAPYEYPVLPPAEPAP